MDKTIVILGGGIAGVVAARELRRHLGPRHRIVVVDKNPFHEFPPSFPWVMIGWRKADLLRRPFSLLAKHEIEFVRGTVEEIDPARGSVRIDGTALAFDYLVIALGAERDATNGGRWSGDYHRVATASGAQALAHELPRLVSGRVAVLAADPAGMLPPFSVEAALLLESFLSRKAVPGLRIDLVTAGPSFLHPALRVVEPQLRRIVAERSIHVLQLSPEARIRVEAQTLQVDGGACGEYDLIIGVDAVRPAPVLARSGLADNSGLIPVDPQELRTSHAAIFALGDAAGIALEDGTTMPRMGTLASSQGEAVARVISAEILQKGEAKGFDGVGYCFVETGNGRAGYIFSDFYALPSPQVTFHEPNVTYHWGKVVFEKYWMWRWL